jgi:hypothetical protein
MTEKSYRNVFKKFFNKETEKAIKGARAGIGIIKTSSHEDLMKKLRN